MRACATSVIQAIPIPAFATIGEAFLLGLTTGPVCLASCGRGWCPGCLRNHPQCVRMASSCCYFLLRGFSVICSLPPVCEGLGQP